MNIDAITIALILTALINSTLGLMVLFAGKITRVNRLYVFNVVTILSWVAGMIFYRLADASTITEWTKVLYVAPTLIASTFFYFTYIFPEKQKEYRNWKIAIIFGVNIGLILLTLFTSTVILYSEPATVGEPIIHFGSLYILYVLYTLYYFSYSFYRLYRKYSNATDEIEKRQSLFLFIGYSLSGNIAFITNLILPWFNYFVVNWLGQVSTIFMVLSATYAIFRYKLFDIRVIATELFVGSLWVFLIVRILIATNTEDQIVNGILLLVTVVIGIFLIRSVAKEVAQREKIEKLATDLEEANKRLVVLDGQKSEFVSLASHQLRGPLTAIKGYASLILEGDFGEISSTVRDGVDKIFKSTQALVVLVGDYLDVSRIEQGRMQYDFSVFNLKELVSSVLGELKPNIEAAHLDLTFDFNVNDTYIVNADQGKIKQIISNMIDNSTKYTKKGWIKVAIQKHDDRKKVVISIQDTGVGIRPEVLPLLFEKFTRAPDASKTNIMGTGLGLYVAKKIIEAHPGGRIWAESPGQDQGSTFFIELAAA